MLFITNRALVEGPTPQNDDGTFAVPRSVQFQLNNNQAEQSVYFCYRNGEGNYTEIGSLAFFDRLKAANYNQLLFYLHGYSSLPEPAIFPRAFELQALFDEKKAQDVLVIPLIWPCDDDLGVVQDYFDDQLAADASAIAYARMFEKFLSWREAHSTLDNPCLKRINVLAHSMGSRVLRGALVDVVKYFQPTGVPMIFRNVFLVASDVNNRTLEFGEPGQFICDASRNVVVYYAADDLAMRASKVANMSVASRRLGQTGPARIATACPNVYAVDCGDFNNIYDAPTGHGYFTRDPNGNPGLLFDHMWAAIRIGRVLMPALQARSLVLRNRFWLQARR